MSFDSTQTGTLQIDSAYSSDSSKYLSFGSREIKKIAASRLSYSNLAKIFLTQAWSEIRLRSRKHINFRKRENEKACQAYCEMNLHEFEAINARQQWANWRTIPKNLNGLLPNRAVFAIDLCCGVGHSTEVLACYLPTGSKVLGLEYNSVFVQRASAKQYTHSSGKVCDVKFRAQSVLESFCHDTGLLVEDESVDLVNSSGAVGCHFDFNATSILAKEIFRVLKRGGLATIDSGDAGTNKDQLIQIFEAQGFVVRHYAKSCALDLYTQVCFSKV